MKQYESPHSSISDAGSSIKGSIVKFVSPKKWKIYMLNILDQMKIRFPQHNLLIVDLATIVDAVSEASLIEATLQIRPFKPEFIETQQALSNGMQSTMAETITKAAHFKNQNHKSKKAIQINQRITEQTLTKEFNHHYHPFKFILKNFRRLLQLKNKAKIDQKKTPMQQTMKTLRDDLNVLTQFLKEASLPYRRLFKLDDQKQQIKATQKLKAFIQTYIAQDKKLHQTLKKIIVYASRAEFQETLNRKLPDFADPDSFDMPQQFKIDGCYIRSINSLMEFSTGCNPEQSLGKLVEFRNNILKDLDDFYVSQTGESQELEVCAEVQIEIIRFILAKLKGWGSQIYAQLKFLEVMYGEDEIGYKFQDASYIFAQLSMAFQIQGIE